MYFDKKVVLFYHVYATENLSNWVDIVTEQLTLAENSKIFDHTDEFYVSLVTTNKNVNKALKIMRDILYSFLPLKVKSEIHLFISPYENDQEVLKHIEEENNITENVTMQLIYNYALLNENSIIGYFHTKGVTAALTKLEKNDYTSFRNYYSWRQLLNNRFFKKNYIAFFELIHKDVIGVNYMSSPAPHYSGSFWYANGSYIKTLLDPEKKDWWFELQKNTNDPWLKNASTRFRDEMWILSNPHANYGSLYSPEKQINYSQVLIKEQEYDK